MKIAVYTCIVGAYDKYREPLVIEDNCDYFIISDEEQDYGKNTKWIDVNTVVPDINMTAKDKNRFCKFHPFSIFAEYDYSIYYDGSVQIVAPVSHNVSILGKNGIAMHHHRCSNCVYTESIFLSWLGVIDLKKSQKEIGKYIKEGLPREYGLFECGVIITDLHNDEAKNIFLNWYAEYMLGVKRDQQALMYVLWKMGLTKDDIAQLGKGYNVYTNPEFSWNMHSHY